MISHWNYGVEWKLKKSVKRATWEALLASCTYTIVSRDGTTYSSPIPLAKGDTVTLDESLTLGYIRKNFDSALYIGTLRTTAYAEIYGRDNWFTSNSTDTLREQRWNPRLTEGGHKPSRSRIGCCMPVPGRMADDGHGGTRR